MPALFLSESDIDRLLDMPAALAAVEEAFRRYAAGQAENMPRGRVSAPGIVLHAMSAAAAYLGHVGWKCYTTTRQGAKFHVGLYDQTSGALVALIQANRLGQLRTGATTGVAMKWLAPADADSMGLFGTGWQAESQLEAVHAVLPLRRVCVYSRDAARRTAFAKRLAGRMALDVQAVDEPQAAARGQSLVVTATTSSQPVFEGRWLSPGTVVAAVGSNWVHKAEIDAQTVGRARLVVCDDLACCQKEAGDLIRAAEQGAFDWSRAVGLGRIVAGEPPPANSRGDIVLFKSVGMALEDVALAVVAVERAKAAGVGVELPI
jgi:ornithine cyclodeaminase/alanine dehydrogenase-like protein (mu-crystallin family)